MGIRPLVVATACAVVLASCSSGDGVPRLDSAATNAAHASISTGTTATSTSSSATSTTVVPSTTRANVSPTTTTSTIARTDTAVEQQLAARVRGVFVAREAANAAPTPNPNSPQLAEFA